jgi:predicted metal-dependent phosphoesterase TrpH
MSVPAREPRIDLHMHSIHSDGGHSPAELLPMALSAGLSAMALTDHDTVSGIPELVEAARGSGIEIVTGVELSSSAGKSDLHILGYLFDPLDETLVRELERFQTGRRERVIEMVRILNGLGIEITLEDVLRQAAGGVLGRPHVAHALLEQGFVETFDEAFRKFLGQHARAFVPKPHFEPRQALELIRSAGGVPVLAHPGTANRDELIPELADMGLAGIEAWHPKHNPVQVVEYRRLAAELGLVATGGSDFHGSIMGNVTVGISDVPAAVLAALRDRL